MDINIYSENRKMDLHINRLFFKGPFSILGKWNNCFSRNLWGKIYFHFVFLKVILIINVGQDIESCIERENRKQKKRSGQW